MSRSYKNVERFIQAWVFQREHAEDVKSPDHASSWTDVSSDASRPFLPLTPLRSTDLYWDSQFVLAS